MASAPKKVEAPAQSKAKWGADAVLSGLSGFGEELANRVWKQSSTFRRLIFSRHVLDLQLIFIVALVTTFVLLLWGLESGMDKQFVGAVLLASGTILGWTYQTGSKRLGVVDLFACEIVTICRVGTIMDVIPRLIRTHERLSKTSAPVEVPDTSHHEIGLERFASQSQEDYFPVFSQNAKDLQVLEADVVINVTAFYTYMKVFRDQMRSLGELESGDDSEHRKSRFVNAIYMIFLGYESARKSIEALVEFEPTQAEAMVTGLVSELPAYRFLTRHFERDDIRGRRLALRENKYGEFVPALCDKIFKTTADDWENARSTSIDLRRVYNDLGFMPKIA